MKVERWTRSFVLALLLLAMMALSGCGDAQQEAMGELHRLGESFTVSDYIAAAAKGELEAVQLFVASGMGVDSADAAGMRAVIKAAERGQFEVVKWLVENGADPNGVGVQGRTPIIAAAQGGHTEVIRLLLSNRADPRATDDDDWSALTLSAYRGHVGAVALLAPRTPELLDDALLVSAFEGNPEVIDSLLNSGAYVNARSPNSQTALMIASMNGRLDAVKLLLHNGANRYALDDSESTAGNLAIQNGYDEVGDFLNQPPTSSEEFVLEKRAGIEEPIADEWLLPPEVFEVAENDRSADGGRIDPKREVAPGKPPRAQGIQIHHEAIEGKDLAATFRMRDYREECLPVILKGVGEENAEVRVLYRDGDPIIVKAGEVIADTGLEVVSFDRRFTNSKHGKGSMVDVSQMIVADRATGAKHLLLKGIPARSSEVYALMSLDDSGKSYEVRAEDEFTAEGAEAEEHFRVVDVRPNQVVIENTGSREIYTVPRGLGTERSR